MYKKIPEIIQIITISAMGVLYYKCLISDEIAFPVFG